ncbi:MAG: hypothetical protein ABSD70_00105 [Terracidiphilus sp.]|jgi:hypothetical protein
MKIPTLKLAVWAAAGMFVTVPAAFAADNNTQQGQGSAVVTVVNGQELPGGIPQQALQLKVDGKESTITGWTALRGPQSKVELVVLIDDGARTSLGTQLSEIAKFIGGLPPNAEVAVAYMMNGRAAFSGPLTGDRATVERQLHLPLAGMPGINASPYFCLSDLAKHWPSQNTSARREVVMVTDGVDNYDRRFDPQDPYVQAAIDDAVRARLVVYSIYWTNSGRFDSRMYGANAGQNLLAEVTEATGGNSYWMGFGNPVSFQPYFADIDRRLDNQYELDFMTPVGSKPQIENLRLKLNAPAKVDAPQQVYVHSGE